MAVDTSRDKNNTVSLIQTQCAKILDAVALAKQIRQEAIDKGYAPGSSDPITDAFLQNGAFPGLTAQNVVDALTAIANLDTSLAATSRQDYIRLEKLRP